MKKTLFIIFILFLGALGGFLGEEMVFKNLKADRTTIINRQEEVIIKLDEAVEKLVDKEGQKIVAVYPHASLENYDCKDADKCKKGVSGFYLTSDGLIATIYSPLLEKARKIYVFDGNETIEAVLLKKDIKNRVAILKISKNNLPMVSFGENDINLGSAAILLARDLSSLFISQGIISRNPFDFSLKGESLWQNGGPIFNLKGEAIGIADLDKNLNVKIIPIDILENLLTK